jgi:protein-disulfide isomerase
MNKQFFFIVSLVVAVLVGIFVVTSGNKESTGGEGSGGQAQASNHVQGAGNKNVTLVEFGDFQCPACRSFYPIIKQIKETYGDDITFQFRHYPLTQIHPNAFAAHRSAEAAGKQGKFFEMHDLLYENQEAWSNLPDPTQAFASYAQQLELNIEQYQADAAGEEVNDIINADIKLAQEAGAASTPTFVLNGEKIQNPKSFEEFKQLIDEAIAKADS